MVWRIASLADRTDMEGKVDGPGLIKLVDFIVCQQKFKCADVRVNTTRENCRNYLFIEAHPFFRECSNLCVC